MDQNEQKPFDASERPETVEPVMETTYAEMDSDAPAPEAEKGPEGEESESGGKVNVWKELYEWVQAIAVAIVIALLVNQFLFSIVQVQGTSMVPTLHDQERLIVSKLLYEPKDRDIVVIKSEALGKYIVKRVIAVEGQTVDIDVETGDVTVDGDVLDEPYIAERMTEKGQGDMTYPLTVPEGYVFCMGDNRNNSTDSRFQIVGLIDTRYSVGKAFYRIGDKNLLLLGA